MRVALEKWNSAERFGSNQPQAFRHAAQWVLAFGSKETLDKEDWFSALQRAYPHALIMGCSTSGEILGANFLTDSLVTAAVYFESSTVQGHTICLTQESSDYQAGLRLAKAFDAQLLQHVFVLSEGLNVNGAELIRGLASNLPPGVTCTGGLAGGGDLQNPSPTVTFCNSTPQPNLVTAVGLYGSKLHVGYGSFSGWAPFGPDRLITKSKGKVLYELDGQSALTLYKKYLGDYAQGLPLTGVNFPLSLRMRLGEQGVVRSVASVNEAEQSIIFSGDMPENAYVRLMHSSADRVLDGASLAAWVASDALKEYPNKLSILVSCVLRRVMLKKRTEEELENAAQEMGPETSVIGFYSFGELCPFGIAQRCQFHNQTMTITTIAEEP